MLSTSSTKYIALACSMLIVGCATSKQDLASSSDPYEACIDREMAGKKGQKPHMSVVEYCVYEASRYEES